MAKRNNSSRPSNRSGSNRYPGDPRRTDPYRYYEDRDAGYRRSHTQQSGRYADHSRFFEEEYGRRSSGYSYGRNRGGDRDYRQGRYDSRYDSRYDGRYGGRSSDQRRRNPNRPASGRGGKNDRNRKPKKRKRPVRLKKRFYFFLALLILLVAV
ncbi:MAG: hypothetical protein IKT15_01950, partial [Firmicutes bacterium]|nr:hypothetical protein [Bacillota bacterium]